MKWSCKIDNKLEAVCTWGMGTGGDIILKVNETLADLSVEEAIRLSNDLACAALWAKEQEQSCIGDEWEK